MLEKIAHTDYEKLADSVWQNGELPPDKTVVHVHGDNIVPFFELCRRTNNRYVLISSNSDYSFMEQEKNPVHVDMQKWLKYIDCKDLGYNPLIVPTRCNIAQCRATDKYSVKVYSYTKFTFDEIPDNIVTWFATNCDIEDNRIQRLPFGVAEWSKEHLKHRDKDKTLYVNFLNATIERSQLMNFYKTEYHNDLICERDVPIERYVDCVARSKFCLAPTSNGLDSYRILESLYCRTIPVTNRANWSKCYDNLPVLMPDSLFLNINDLNLSYNDLNRQANWNLENTVADLNYWRNRINDARKNLS